MLETPMPARLVCLLCLLCAAPLPAQSRTDHLGDPLPAGAVARLGTVRLRHHSGHGINDLAFSPDGRFLASTGEFGHGVHLWDADTGKLVRTLPPPPGTQGSCGPLAFSASGRLIASGTYADEDNLLLWDATTGKLLHGFAGHRGAVGDLRFRDGDKVLVSVGAYFRVSWWDVATGKCLRVWDADPAWPDPKANRVFGGWRRAVVSPDGTSISAEALWARPGGSLYPERTRIVWNLGTGKEQWRLPAEDSSSSHAAFSPDGSQLAFHWTTKGPAIYHTATGKVSFAIPLPDLPPFPRQHLFPDGWDFAFTADGKQLAVATRGFGVRLWDVATGKPLQSFRPVPRFPHAASSGAIRTALSADGKRVAMSWGQALWLWDITTGQPLPPTSGHCDPVEGVQFSADGKRLFSRLDSSHQGPHEVIAWDTTTWRQLACSLRGDDASGKEYLWALTNDHQLCVRCRADQRTLVVRETDGGKLVCQLEDVVSSAPGFSASGRMLLMLQRDEKNWSIIDGRTGKRLSSFSNFLNDNTWVGAFSRDDRYVAGFSRGGVIRVQSVATGKELQMLGRPRDNWGSHPLPALVFCPHGRYLASWETDDNGVILWDLNTGKQCCRIPDHLPMRVNDHSVCLAFSPDGRMLAVGGRTGEKDIRVFEVATGLLRLRLVGHAGIVNGLAFSPNGRLLASASDDTTVLVWDLSAAAKARP
jgi:WD40 repeat protein